VSSPLAIAAVTAVLKDLLNEGLINNDLAQVGSFSVSALPPDRIATGDTEENRLNLFLYQVTPNQGWRNAGLASHGARGERLSNPPLALDLHYMLTAYGQVDLNAEILLGYAMEILHDTQVLSRSAIRRSLSPNNPINVALIPEDGQGRAAADLADQIEAIKIVPHYLSADELSRMWTAMQARYRPTVAYQVSTVLIQAARPVRVAPPVLTRGRNDEGVHSRPDPTPPMPALPLLETVTIRTSDGRTPISAELGDTLVLDGALLDGEQVRAEFRHRLLSAPKELPLLPGSDGRRALVALPAVDAGDAGSAWPAGSYTVCLRIERSGKPVRRSNECAFRLAPRLQAPPQVSIAGGVRQLGLTFFPLAWPGQRIDIFVAGEPFRPAPPAAKVGSLTVPIPELQPAETPLPVQLRIDGVDSVLVRDRHAQPPQFDPLQTIEIPA
jgi:hypothetical protein